MDELTEECGEIHASGDIDELADVVEVVLALVSMSGMSWEAFDALRLARRRDRGGFDDGVLPARRPEVRQHAPR